MYHMEELFVERNEDSFLRKRKSQLEIPKDLENVL